MARPRKDASDTTLTAAFLAWGRENGYAEAIDRVLVGRDAFERKAKRFARLSDDELRSRLIDAEAQATAIREAIASRS